MPDEHSRDGNSSLRGENLDAERRATPLDYYLQPCARCGSGKYVVDYTEVIGESRRRVLCCRSCRHHPPVSVWVVPLSSSPARSHQKRQRGTP